MYSVDGNTVIASAVGRHYSPSSGSRRHPPREEKEKQPFTRLNWTRILCVQCWLNSDKK